MCLCQTFKLLLALQLPWYPHHLHHLTFQPPFTSGAHYHQFKHISVFFQIVFSRLIASHWARLVCACFIVTFAWIWYLFVWYLSVLSTSTWMLLTLADLSRAFLTFTYLVFSFGSRGFTDAITHVSVSKYHERGETILFLLTAFIASYQYGNEKLTTRPLLTQHLVQKGLPWST